MADERRTRRTTVTTGGGNLTKDEWRRFDLSKLWVWIILVAVAIVLMLLRGCNPQAAAPLATATSAATAAPTTEPTVVAAATNTPVPPEPTSMPAEVAAPAVDPQDGVIPAGPVTLSGKAAPGADLDILVDGVSVGTATAAADGAWSIDVDLAAGDHEIVVVAPADAGGSSAPQAFQIGSGAGPDPVTVTEPIAGATVAPGAIQFSGTAGPGAELVVMVDGVEMTRITAGSDGAWATELELSEGGHSVVVAPVSTDGTVVFDEAASAPVEFLAEVTGVAPVFTEPEASADLSAGPVIFRGTAAPGSTIALQLDGEDVRTVVAEDDGTWSAEIDLPAGEHRLVAVATQRDGLEAVSETFDIAATAALPVITSPAAGNVTSGNVVLRGTASPNQTLEIVVDGVVVGTTTSDARGNWFLSAPLTAGARSVTARYPGATDSSEPVAYSVQQRRPGGQCRNTTPIPAEVGRYTVEVNDTLYCISQRSGLSIATLRRDNPFITDENLILPGQVLTLREHVPPTPAPPPTPTPAL